MSICKVCGKEYHGVFHSKDEINATMSDEASSGATSSHAFTGLDKFRINVLLPKTRPSLSTISYMEFSRILESSNMYVFRSFLTADLLA